MKWHDLMRVAGDEPVFRTGLVLSGQTASRDIRRQISRWVSSGRLHALRRGVYALAQPYARTPPHPFFIANSMKRGSYISLQSALAHYGMIPEYVPVTTSVTTGRPEELDTPLGRFTFRHVHKRYFCGFASVEVMQGQTISIASPEKALLDLFHLTPGSDSPHYLRELRLTLPDNFSWATMDSLLASLESGKLNRAARNLRRVLEAEGEFVTL